MDNPPPKKIKFDVPPPTVQELNNLKEAETLFHSSLFRLEVDEMMKAVKIKIKQRRHMEQFLESLKLELYGINPSEVYSITDESWINSENVVVPILEVPTSDKGKFQFLAPSQIQEIGSYTLGSSCSEIITVDCAVEIPKDCWQQTDCLNHRYHRKRAMYLSYLAKELKTSNLVKSLKFSFLDGCYMKPVLLLTPKGICHKYCKIRLMPFPDEKVFKLSRFIPSKNNVRPSWFCSKSTADEYDIPTPRYNSSILADVLLLSLSNFLREEVSSKNIADGIILLKVWSIQRGFFEGFGGFNGFVISMLVSYLLKNRKINHRMSSYQVFRNTLLFIVKHDWCEDAITLSQEKKENQPSLEEFKNFHDVTFIDPSGFLNICANMQKETISMIHYEAQLGLRLLDSGSSDSFSLLFLNRIPFCRRFDYLIHVSCRNAKEIVEKLPSPVELLCDYGNNVSACIAPNFCNILRKALGQRITQLNVEREKPHVWSVSKTPPNPNGLKKITFGLLLNQDFAFNPLEKGPITEDPKSIEFRDFWGEKSELRRFQDGTVCEAVLWKVETIDDQRKIIDHMVKHVLKRHAGVDPNDVHLIGTNVLSTLNLPGELAACEGQNYGTGEEVFVKIQNSFVELTKELRKLDDLPLLISSIQGTSPSFRFCEVFPPVPAIIKKMNYYNATTSMPSLKAADIPAFLLSSLVHVLIRRPANVFLVSHISVGMFPLSSVIINLEGSGKWPDDIKAIRMLKTAFYIKLAGLIKSQFGHHTFVSETHIDVFKDGYAFQLTIACHKEIFLLKQAITSNSTKKKGSEAKESCELERSTHILPKLNNLFHGLHQQHNSYGTACRLAKRWISSQLLYDYISEEAVELLVASLYVNSEPYSCPSSPQIAFQRFLSLISSHDWRISPLIINLNDELTKVEIFEIQSNFTAHRPTLPPMVLSHPLDKSGCMWTREMPTSSIMHRLITLAKHALETFEKKMYEPLSDFKVIFRPPMNIYDVIIHLNPLKTPRMHFALDLPESIHFPRTKKKCSDQVCRVDHDPVRCYLKELRDTHDEHALFFYDAFGGNYIAVLWKPQAFVPQSFKVSHINGKKQLSAANADGLVNIAPNVEAILLDFELIASLIEPGMFKSIEKRVEKWTIS